jgi:hypothetical protein
MSSPEIDRFLANHITSMEHLEVLLLLFRSPDTYWSADAIATQLSIRRETVDGRVRDLARSNLALPSTSAAAWRFHSADPDISRTITELAELYRDRRISVVNAIYSANLTRLRTFADAFRLGKKKEEE